jgi:hypothetical protein
MQTQWQKELEAMRQKLAQQNEQWARAEECLATYSGPIPIPPQLIAELDRVCDVTVRSSPKNIHNGAIRA